MTAVVIGLAVLAAYQGPRPPVPVLGDVAALTGRWEGTYGSRESGRTGSILFTLAAGTDTTHGDVLLVPGAWDLPPQALPIAFVRAADGLVESRLAPYRDPDCGCLLTTHFSGCPITVST